MTQTISFFLNVFKTRLQTRTEVGSFRHTIGEIVDLNERSIELTKGESATITADHFLLFTCLEILPVTLTTHRKVSGVWTANTAVSVLWQGVISLPGKVLISINNPMDNPSDLPYRFEAVYS